MSGEVASGPRRRPASQALSAITSGLMIAVFVIVAAVGTLAIVVPAAVGGRALTVLTSSMEPRLPPGTLVIVRPTPADEVRTGEVLTYQLRSGEPTLVTHRVIQRLALADGSTTFITQGDNSPNADPDPVREVQVVGTVWYSIPFLGWVAQGITGETRAWLIPLVAGALFAYAAWMLAAAIRERRRRADS